MRGDESTALGLIPACAGSTTTFWRAACGARAHPRMRGEHPFQIAPNQSFIGSSPHARGARAAWTVQGLRWRLIPACAGSTPCAVRARTGDPAHPRMRGEHVEVGQLGRYAGGSSPHARGAHVASIMSAIRWGLIPACAGSTVVASLARNTKWAHPRMRGEHVRKLMGAGAQSGSSPHARGALNIALGGVGHARLIPACAGSTSSTWTRSCAVPAHPRMRGEHLPVDYDWFGRSGSSPHARGARWRSR